MPKMIYAVGQEHFLVEGKGYSLPMLWGISRAKGHKLSRQCIYSRLIVGDDTFEKLFRPAKDVGVKARVSSAQRKRDEMKELLERLGPPKRY